jgi:hypothetical protein
VLCFQAVSLGLRPLSAQTKDDFPDRGAFFNGIARRPRPTRHESSRVEALLKKMIIEEKVGQMTQLTIDSMRWPGQSTIKFWIKRNISRPSKKRGSD